MAQQTETVMEESPKTPEFSLQPQDMNRRTVRPQEPLHSLLVEAPLASIEYLYQQLADFQDDSALEDVYPSVGLTRREYLEQVMLAMDTRERYLGHRG